MRFFRSDFGKKAHMFWKIAISGNTLFRAIFRGRAVFSAISEKHAIFRPIPEKTRFSAQFCEICVVDFRSRAERAGLAVLALNGRGTPAAGAACRELAGERGFAFS